MDRKPIRLPNPLGSCIIYSGADGRIHNNQFDPTAKAWLDQIPSGVPEVMLNDARPHVKADGALL